MALTVNTQIINDTDQHLLDAKNVKGTFVVVTSTTERNVLPAATTVNGSLCYCTADSKFYQYNGSSWQEKEFGTNATNDAYNLGYYDTITKNDDGTYTITRQTGYIVLNGVTEKNASVAQNGSTSTYRYTFDIVNGSGQNGDVISNLLTKILFGDLVNGRTGIAMYSATRCSICISGITTLADYKSHLSRNNIYVQYKLATATTEKVEKNHYARYNERFILEHNKSEAERSANLVNTFDRSNIPSNSSLYTATLNTDGSYTTNVSSDSRNWDYPNTDFKLHLTKGTYSFSITGKTISSNSNTGMRVIDSNSKTLCTAHSGNSYKSSFTLTSDTDVGILIKPYTSEDLKIMLNKGSVALAYQPYEGKVIHEKDLKNVSTNLGYYDTITENPDGSYTITRQTGYHNISTDLIKNGYYRQTQNGHGEYGGDNGIHNLPIAAGSKNFINNLLTVRDNGEVYAGSTGISITENGMCWVNLGDNYTTTEQYREYFAKNNIYVQYRLTTATTEKVEKNHYARYNERYILEHNKSEAERSANLYSGVQTCSGSDTREYFRPKLQAYDNNNTVILNLGLNSITSTNKIASFTFNKTSEMNKIRFGHDGSAEDILLYCDVSNFVNGTYTLSFLVTGYTGTQSFTNIMLNVGSVALPYQPYNQNKHITNNEAVFLKNESDRSANLFDINTITIGKGYDYTATASDWVKAIDIPVEPNTTYTASYPIAKYAFNHGNIVSDYNKNTVTTGNDTTSLSLFMYVGDYSGTVNAWFSNYMLNEGSVSLPYQPYKGKVIHEKDLKNVSTNLGYYDTITENPDGSYTITKQTGYINGKDFLNRSVNGVGNPYVTFEHVKANKNIENIIGNCGRVGPDSWWNSTFSEVTITYDGNYDFLIILLPNGTADNDTTPLNDIHVQYKLPNKRTEKVEKNYCAQYNKRFILEHNKREAAKSSNLWSYENNITINAGSEKWWTLSNATMDAWGLVVGETYSIKSFVNNYTKDLAFQILPGWVDFRDGRTFVFTNDTQIRIGGNTVASSVTFTPKIMLVKGIDIADEYQPYSGAPIHKKEFEDFKNSMKFIPYVSVVETSSSQDISENGTYFVVPTNPSDASLKLQVKAGPQGTLQTAYFSGGIISVYRNYDRKFQVCEVKITYGAGSSAASTYILDAANYGSLPSGILTRVTGRCKIYKLI